MRDGGWNSDIKAGWGQIGRPWVGWQGKGDGKTREGCGDGRLREGKKGSNPATEQKSQKTKGKLLIFHEIDFP